MQTGWSYNPQEKQVFCLHSPEPLHGVDVAVAGQHGPPGSPQGWQIFFELQNRSAYPHVPFCRQG